MKTDTRNARYRAPRVSVSLPHLASRSPLSRLRGPPFVRSRQEEDIAVFMPSAIFISKYRHLAPIWHKNSNTAVLSVYTEARPAIRLTFCFHPSSFVAGAISFEYKPSCIVKHVDDAEDASEV
jgi:hypothetical protein